ncbi:Leucine-rich repeat-containing protein 2, partial [Irineochytrium annulatum]
MSTMTDSAEPASEAASSSTATTISSTSPLPSTTSSSPSPSTTFDKASSVAECTELYRFIKNNSISDTLGFCCDYQVGANYILCDSQYRVAVINLNYMQINGPLLNLSYFNHSTNIFLSKNNLTGSLPSNLASSLPVLKVIDLTANSLTGSIPRLPDRLKCLDMSHNQLSGSPEHLFSAQSLTYADVSNNQLTGTLPSAVPKNLTNLYMVGNRLNGRPPTPAAGDTSVIDLSFNCLTLAAGQQAATRWVLSPQEATCANATAPFVAIITPTAAPSVGLASIGTIPLIAVTCSAVVFLSFLALALMILLRRRDILLLPSNSGKSVTDSSTTAQSRSRSLSIDHQTTVTVLSRRSGDTVTFYSHDEHAPALPALRPPPPVLSGRTAASTAAIDARRDTVAMPNPLLSPLLRAGVGSDATLERTVSTMSPKKRRDRSDSTLEKKSSDPQASLRRLHRHPSYWTPEEVAAFLTAHHGRPEIVDACLTHEMDGAALMALSGLDDKAE